MNKRIEELAEQATDEYHYSTWNSIDQKEVRHYKFNKEKFAELIVKECVTKMASEIMNNSWIDDAVKNTYKHFGVE